MAEAWVPYVYQYGIGGIVFVVGMTYAWRQDYIGFEGKKLRRLLILVGGMFFFMVLQGYLQFAPMETRADIAYTGEPMDHEQIGTPLDYGVMIGYFVAILAVGTFFGRGQKTTKDFFFGGQRFSWWLIAFSLVATTIGSYSFVKYSQIAYNHGIASSQTYLNDWFWMPLFAFGWLPLLYFSRVTSIPEYFQRRFGPTTRHIVTILLLVYMVGYVGVNLFTMGRALSYLLGWDVLMSAMLVAGISTSYVTFGGQTSVIMTDLLQGVMLLAAGLLIVWLGIDYLGGFDAFWEHLPRGHRKAFSNFNEDPAYNTVGVFWQDAMANSAMFYFLNQGILMRFMAARSIDEGRKAAFVVPLMLMPVAAVVVASGGWVGKALVGAGVMDSGVDPKKVFFIASEMLSTPGVFGLIMAALTAALMSTVDTLVTAVSAIVVNDVYRPLIRPDATDKQQLNVARWSAVGVMLVGLSMVPILDSFDSIYSAHGAFTAAVTPPLVVALLLGVFWHRYTSTAAIWTLAGGSFAILVSIFIPEIITPFAQGVPMNDVEPGFLSGVKQYKFMRAFFGLGASALIGVTVTLFTKPRSEASLRGLVWGTVSDALTSYKGSPGKEMEGHWVPATLSLDAAPGSMNNGFETACLSPSLAKDLGVDVGDLIYLSDPRWWYGGLRSTHAIVGTLDETLPEGAAALGADPFRAVANPGTENAPIRIKKMY